MPTKESSVTTIADATRNLLTRNMQPQGAWSATTFAAEMQKAGHNWTPAVVYAALKKDRLFTVDEVTGVLGVLKAHATIILKEIDNVAKLVVSETEKVHK